MKKNANILWFKEIDKDDISIVGGKGANLGEMTTFNIPVPKGFVISAKAYFDFLEENQFRNKIKEILSLVNISDPQTLNAASQKIQKLLLQGKVSQKLSKEIINSYLKLGGLFHQVLVAIRSSATAEDLPTASFAGQQSSFLNVRGEADVVQRVRECWASLFEPRAIFYRQEKGFDHFKVGIAVIIQGMVPAEISGVMFTIDPVNNLKNRILIEAIYGLGEYLVQGEISPDMYIVDLNSLKILKRIIEKQTIQLIKVKNFNQKASVPKNLQLKRKLTDKQITELATLGKKIHKHYFYPQDIEWTLYKNKFFIVQTRPVTTIKESKSEEEKSQGIKRKPLLVGQAASPGINFGPVQLIKSAKEINKIQIGDVLVTQMTTPDFVPAMKKVAAIITDKGGQTSHAAIVSRELGVPCVVGTKIATSVLKNGLIVTVNGSKGEIYKGGLKLKGSNVEAKIFTSQTSVLKSHVPLRTATKIYVNLGEPELAKEVAQKDVDGIGLLRAEFMIAQIGIHPKKIIKEKKEKLFSEKLANDLSIFCQHFYPRPVVYRTADFKTNEYRNLLGGKAFEPEEENPFLGYRGAFRYICDPAVLELELQAIKRVRDKYNLKNLWLMIPFCRTVKELQEVKKIVVSHGLARSTTFKLWLMVEVPSNVILLEDFVKVGIDGVSIGSNDLTMLLLGVDRDNAELARAFNELDPVSLWALKKTIKTCHKLKITSSCCGQAPSNHPDLVEKLVEWGITSISVNPDAIERTKELVYEVEKRVAQKKHGKN